MRWTRPWLMPLLLMVAGCDEREPPFSAYQHFRDALASKSFGLLGYPCVRTKTVNEQEVFDVLAADQCYKMRSTQRYRGIWLDEFEGSAFFENAATPADVKARYLKLRETSSLDRNEWLSFSVPLERSRSRRSSPHSRMIAIDFIGRRPAYKGRYGHMGMSGNLIVVDRIISMKLAYQSKSPYLSDEMQR